MTKINKININGNIYDIQDNSSGYVKGTEISDLVNQLVDEKVAEFLKAGFNTETVDELPTENISYKTIYLVPSEKEEEENIYDEYIYTSKDEWEKIGSTKTDLSNHYTKEEVDSEIENLDSRINDNFICLQYNDNSEETISKLEYMINKYKNKDIYCVISTRSDYIVYEEYQFVLSCSILNVGTKNTYFFRNNSAPVSYQHQYYQALNITGEWVEETFQISELKYTPATYSNKFLSTNNTSSYTPTGDYNPAPKKYVDDSIATALGDVETILATLTTIEESE